MSLIYGIVGLKLIFLTILVIADKLQKIRDK